MTSKKSPLLRAYDNVVRGWRRSARDHYTLIGPRFLSEFAARSGELTQGGMNSRPMYRFLRAAYKTEGELVAAIDRTGKWFDRRTSELEERNQEWTPYQNLKTNVNAVNRALSNGGDSRPQILVVLISFELMVETIRGKVDE